MDFKRMKKTFLEKPVNRTYSNYCATEDKIS